MKITTLACILLLSLTVAELSAQTVRFRSGEILAAELSKEPPEDVRNRDELDLSDLPDRRIYAALTVSLTSGRKISIYDYSLKAGGVKYRCVALRIGDNSIDAARFETVGSGRGNRCTLYFVLDPRDVGRGSHETLTLVCGVPPEPEIPVVFKSCGSNGFTTPSKIPASGNMTEVK